MDYRFTKCKNKLVYPLFFGLFENMYSKEELKNLKKNFWASLKLKSKLKAGRGKWLLNNTKVNGLVFRFDVNRKDAKVILELQHKSENRRLKMYEILEKYKVILEDGFEKGLIWDYFYEREDNGHQVCRIYTQLDNVDFHRQNQWEEIHDFFIENMARLEDNFLEVKDILVEEMRR